jgi:hypothetical protein
MKVLVCGGRDFNDWTLLCDALDAVRIEHGVITHIIHGCASGADKLADDWALMRGVQPVRCPANWNWQDKAAGPIRNAAMLALKPDLVVALPGGRGTADMVAKAEKAGVRVMHVA